MEEREIYTKGQKLFEQLIDESTLQTCLNKLDGMIQKFRGAPESV